VLNGIRKWKTISIIKNKGAILKSTWVCKDCGKPMYAAGGIIGKKYVFYKCDECKNFIIDASECRTDKEGRSGIQVEPFTFILPKKVSTHLALPLSVQ